MLKQSSKTIILLAVWLSIVPAAIYFAITYFPMKHASLLTFLLLIIILTVTVLHPIDINGVKITMDRWILFATFFQYGLVTELFMMQFCLLLIIVSNPNSIPLVKRFMINSWIFAGVSLVSAYIYHAAGGTIGASALPFMLFAGTIYAATYTFANSLFLYISFLLFPERKVINFRRIIVWDFNTTMINLPMAIAFCLLMEEFGNLAVALLGIPAVVVILIIRLYFNAGDFSKKLQTVSEIGHDLADRLKTEEAYTLYLTKMHKISAYEEAYLIGIRNGEFRLIHRARNGYIVPRTEMMPPIMKYAKDLDHENIQLYKKKPSTKKYTDLMFEGKTESVLTVPIHYNESLEAFIVLSSSEKNAFSSIEIEMVELLAQYFAVSVAKAQLYEQTIEEGEHCGLTKLPNLRSLLSKIDKEMELLHHHKRTALSAIMMDIDHFKNVNDTYGHQSGNDVLVAFANVLKKFTYSDSVLARYGGEEFTLLLPDTSKEEAVRIAEAIRKEVEQLSFRITPDLSSERKPTDIHLTLSLGVATIPDDTDDASHLLRNADRALYIGGKQAGRNRVGVYRQETAVI